MVKKTNNRVLRLAVMIALAIVTVSCVTVIMGMHMIVEAEQHQVRNQMERLTEERYKFYGYQEGISTGSMCWINERNKCSIVQIIGRGVEPNVTLEIYINSESIDLQKPLVTITPALNKVFEEDIEDIVIDFCQSHQIDYHKDSIVSLDVEVFSEMINALQEETRGDR